MAGPHPAVARLRNAVRPGLATVRGPVLVACSGGADSLGLAAALAFEAPRAGVRCAAVTVDHGLQEGSAERAEATAALLRDLGLDPVLVRRVEVGPAGGPEGAARTARHAALGSAATETTAVGSAPATVALGHTLDDQAETVLLGLGRGSGPRSIAGMVEHRTDGGTSWWRPLLGVPRSSTRAACDAQGLPVWDDPWNADPAYARVRLRSTALPALEQALGGGVAAALARTASMLREDLDALDALGEQQLCRLAAGDGSLPTRETAELPAALRRRVLRGWLRDARVADLQAVHLSAVDELLTRWHGQGPVTLPGGVSVLRSSGRLTTGSAQAGRPTPSTNAPPEEIRP